MTPPPTPIVIVEEKPEPKDYSKEIIFVVTLGIVILIILIIILAVCCKDKISGPKKKTPVFKDNDLTLPRMNSSSFRDKHYLKATLSLLDLIENE